MFAVTLYVSGPAAAAAPPQTPRGKSQSVSDVSKKINPGLEITDVKVGNIIQNKDDNRVHIVTMKIGSGEGARIAVDHNPTANYFPQAFVMVDDTVRTNDEITKWIEGHKTPKKGKSSSLGDPVSPESVYWTPTTEPDTPQPPQHGQQKGQGTQAKKKTGGFLGGWFGGLFGD